MGSFPQIFVVSLDFMADKTPRSPQPLPDNDPRDPDRLLSSYDYILPSGQIAQNPVRPRDHSRLLVVTSQNSHEHHIFYELAELLQPGDLLVFNNTRVIPARLYGKTVTGGQIEVLLLEEGEDPQIWLALVKPGKRFKPGSEIEFGQVLLPDGKTRLDLTATVVDRDEATGGRYLRFNLPVGTSLVQVLEQLGQTPLPPYITDSQADPEQYQTVYASQPGSAAAPTAGLHFTPELLARLEEKGIRQVFLTLHVGVGTFRPVEVEDITHHAMHGEWLDLSSEVVEAIRETKLSGGRVIAVGTTATRALEGAAAANGKLEPYCGKTDLFIYPGYQWRVVEGLITNFHLPRSSLMMLVSALLGRQRLLSLYQDAIAQNYRFYSFGDAMLILPEARVIS
jgi:S-adenosylmethionine:tRNA ribosyltransferase-isomerase